jgi:hypothetical protein
VQAAAFLKPPEKFGEHKWPFMRTPTLLSPDANVNKKSHRGTQIRLKRFQMLGI